MKLKAISCDVFKREMYAAASHSPHTVDIEFLSTGQHVDDACSVRKNLQRAINSVDGPYDAIVLGYGLCNYALCGVAAVGYPLVVPRARDCVALFMGSRHRYDKEMEEQPGTFFKSAGWIDASGQSDEQTQIAAQRGNDAQPKLEDMVSKYGQENGWFFYNELHDRVPATTRLVHINMGLEPDQRWEKSSQWQADCHGWAFEAMNGDLGLIQSLLNGEWDPADFLIVPIGSQISMSYNEGIITTAPAGEYLT